MIYTSSQAREKHIKNIKGFAEIQGRLKSNQLPKPLEVQQEPQETIHSFLHQNGSSSEMSTRYRLAQKLGIKGYTGSEAHDNQMLTMLKGKQLENQSKQMKVGEEAKSKAEMEMKNREFALKEKELSYKQPTKEEIANTLLEKYNNE